MITWWPQPVWQTKSFYTSSKVWWLSVPYPYKEHIPSCFTPTRYKWETVRILHHLFLGSEYHTFWQQNSSQNLFDQVCKSALSMLLFSYQEEVLLTSYMLLLFMHAGFFFAVFIMVQHINTWSVHYRYPLFW